MKRFIVRRTYTKDKDKECNFILYIESPTNFQGTEMQTSVIEKAHVFGVFDSNASHYIKLNGFKCDGNNRDGDFSFKQELLEIKQEVIGLLDTH